MDSDRAATKPRVSMDYPAIRNEIQDGDILLFRARTWRDRLTCWLTRSPYAHSAILGWWNGRLMVLQATPTGVVTSRMSLIVQKYSGKLELWTTDKDLGRFEVIRTAQLLLGKRYPRFQLLRKLEQRMFGNRRQDPPDPEPPPEDFVCSEFVIRMWRAGGVDLVKDSPGVTIKPDDIAKSSVVRKIGDLVRARPGPPAAAPVRRPSRALGSSPLDTAKPARSPAPRR